MDLDLEPILQELTAGTLRAKIRALRRLIENSGGLSPHDLPPIRHALRDETDESVKRLEMELRLKIVEDFDPERALQELTAGTPEAKILALRRLT